MAKRKTIKIEELKRQVNSFLKNTVDRKNEDRKTLGMFLEGILHESGNFEGFRYLTPDNMKDSVEGITFGIDQQKEQKEWFTDTDNSRVKYL